MIPVAEARRARGYPGAGSPGGTPTVGDGTSVSNGGCEARRLGLGTRFSSCGIGAEGPWGCKAPSEARRWGPGVCGAASCAPVGRGTWGRSVGSEARRPASTGLGRGGGASGGGPLGPRANVSLRRLRRSGRIEKGRVMESGASDWEGARAAGARDGGGQAGNV